ncbi:hypothetical protein AM493_11275 [Flavobacterium akiainvivens]|uniref:Uncharacterized protein n=1 Tax=Flavobacterium akiainvivens TaxID=1202724 RepID=A0A0M8MHV2_9FLAO|nr:hypothetical protein [Flavobacterium akiainvivens]KOS06551.1 hypothetical protein AM493_11275 [Flavobacterium akiainvivens]SFQ10739.1 hypothetical protein SAMN05444144_101103 [Flavobacterium akiainvivens]
MNIKLLILLTFLLPLVAVAQRDTLRGRVMVAGENASGVYVINKNTGTEVKSGARGLFKLPAKAGDRLVVYSDRTVVREFVTGKDWFANMPYVVEVDPKGYELENVQIDRTITPEGLGLVPEGQKRYTVAQRRVKTATDWNPGLVGGVGMLGVAASLDPLINMITGRTKMLKRELKTEEREIGMANIGYLYSNEEITKELNIPAEKVDAFLYFAVEDESLKQAMDNKNEALARLELLVLAGRYMARQEEKEEETQPQQAKTVLPATNNQQPTTKNE